MREQILSFKAKPESVDLENRLIKNAILAQVGEAKGHGFSIEQQFITDLVSQATGGVLCNFGHNWNNMGKQLGRANNVRVEGAAAKGDLKIYENADNSPVMKGMGTWLINQAKEDPESVMLSIRFNPSHFYQYDNQGKQVTLRQDWWGDPIAEYKDRQVYVGLRKLKSVDVVDEGALTDKMFSESEDRSLFQRFFQLFKKENPTDMAAETTPSVIEAKNPDEVGGQDLHKTEATVEFGGKQYKGAEITQLLTELAADRKAKGDADLIIVGLKAENAQLKAENVELKKQPAGELTGGETGNAGTPKALKSEDPEAAALAAKLRKI